MGEFAYQPLKMVAVVFRFDPLPNALSQICLALYVTIDHERQNFVFQVIYVTSVFSYILLTELLIRGVTLDGLVYIDSLKIVKRIHVP